MALGFKAEEVLVEGLVDQNHISNIKNWLTNTKIPPLSDEQIILFLVSCDHDIEFAQNTIKAYYQIRSDSPELFTNRRVLGDDIQSALRAGRICAWSDEEGYVYIYYDFKRDSHSWNLATTSKLVFMAIEAIIYDYPPKGFHLLVDTDQLGLAILSKVLHPILLRTISNYFLRGLPVMLKTIHLINSGYLARKLLQIIGPFLDKKISEQLVFYPKNENFEKLHLCLSEKALPRDLGGKLPSIDVLQERFIRKMEDMETYYETEEFHSKIGKLFF